MEVEKERFDTWSDDCHMFRTVRLSATRSLVTPLHSTTQSLARVSSCITGRRPNSSRVEAEQRERGVYSGLYTTEKRGQECGSRGAQN